MLVDPGIYQQRLSLCHSCPYHMMWLGALRCSICKCFMAVKAKLAHMHCPQGYW
jgi:hypothetical protein